MSKVLAKLLDHSETEITSLIDQLEAKNGYPSHDVRTIADNLQKVRAKIAELGLDPSDTTAGELYHALLIKFENDSRRFDEHFGLSGRSYDEKIKKAAELVSKNSKLPERWVLRTTAAKKLLKQHPPKRVMKQLNYRSVDSLIKRENIAEIYLGIELIESAAWNKAHFKLASQLGTTAFEMRPLSLQALTSRWGVWESDDLYVCSSDYCVLGLLPTEEIQAMSLLALTVGLLDEVDAKPSEAAKLSPAAAWWSETDHLIANLGEGPVSLNLKDTALNHKLSADVTDHVQSSAQRHFWKDLLSRYENQIPAAEDLLPKVVSPALSFESPFERPAFEYAEDI